MKQRTVQLARLQTILTTLFLAVSAQAESTLEEVKPQESLSFEVPEWTADAVWYQVFVTRFANGETANDPPGTMPWTDDWTKSDTDVALPLRTQLFFRSYGGDLQGLRSRLDYLASLGVNTLYLNPVFSAPSQHKYDTADHRHIDDAIAIAESASRLSGETADVATWKWSASDRYFLDLLTEAHARGMRIVLDGVFNHTGREFWAFRDVVAKGKSSIFANWFDISQWEPTFAYMAWDGPNGHLPRFRRSGDGLDRDVEEYLFAVVHRWMDPNRDGDPSDGIDGWRLDAAEQVPHGFWRRFRRVVKSINPQAIILGEIWTDASNWLSGDQFDAVTNYRFSEPVVEFLRVGAKDTATTTLADQFAALQVRHPQPMRRAMMNLLGSHDTERAVSMLLDPSQFRANQGSQIPRRDLLQPLPENYRRLALAVLLQFTWEGSPLIYYGDELGMYGGDDPFCRAPMQWDRVNADEHGLLALYRRLGRLRHDRIELRRGHCRMLIADDTRGLFMFERASGNHRSIVAINSGVDPVKVFIPRPRLTNWQIVPVLSTSESQGLVQLLVENETASDSLPVLQLEGLTGAILISPATR